MRYLQLGIVLGIIFSAGVAFAQQRDYGELEKYRATDYGELEKYRRGRIEFDARGTRAVSSEWTPAKEIQFRQSKRDALLTTLLLFAVGGVVAYYGLRLAGRIWIGAIEHTTAAVSRGAERGRAGR